MLSQVRVQTLRRRYEVINLRLEDLSIPILNLNRI